MRTDVLVIGAGPYGFAAAGELVRRGYEVTAVGEPFATWHRHTLDGMLLRSDPRASSVHSADGRWSFLAFLAARGIDRSRPVPVALFREYLREVAHGAPFPLVEDRVERLEADGDGFRARLAGGGEVAARAAVLATGMGSHRHLPAALAALPPELVLHSWDVEAIQRLDGLRVLVVARQAAARVAARVERRLGGSTRRAAA